MAADRLAAAAVKFAKRQSAENLCRPQRKADPGSGHIRIRTTLQTLSELAMNPVLQTKSIEIDMTKTGDWFV